MLATKTLSTGAGLTIMAIVVEAYEWVWPAAGMFIVLIENWYI